MTYLMGPLVSLAGQMVTFTDVSAVSISATFGIVGAKGAETRTRATPQIITQYKLYSDNNASYFTSIESK